MAKKRERTANFTESEVRLLVDVVLRHVSVLENRKNDAVSWREKNQQWEVITKELQSLTGNINRSAKMLRLKYDCLKRAIRKKQSNNKIEIFKTGGGPAKVEPLTDYEVKLSSYINGLESISDSETEILSLPVDIINEAPTTATYCEEDNTSKLINYCIVPPIQTTEVEQESDVEEVTSIASHENITPKNKRDKQKHRSLYPVSTTQQLITKLDAATVARKDLILLKLEIIKKEEERQQLEHEEKLKNMQLQRQFLITDEERKRQEFELKKTLLLLEIEQKRKKIEN